MALETIEAGNRALRGPGLGVEKACVLAAFDPEHNPEHLSRQAWKIAAHYGLSAALARAVAELAFATGGRR